MRGDYGTMHIELGPDVTEADADWLNDKVAGIVFEKRRFRGKDIMVSLHTDGDCQASPHCFGAERRRLAKELRAKATSRFDEHGPDDARGAAIWDVANWLTEADCDFVADLRARLADSRPVVSEAAIRACAIHLFTVDRDRKGRGLVDWMYASDYEKDFFTAEAKAALTAALPHMGDGRADAWDEGFSHRDEMTPQSCRGVADCNPYRLSPTGDDSE